MLDTTRYQVNEIFYSIQGEGRWSGRAAVFVRFSKCNLDCPFCDTDFKDYEEMTSQEIVAELQKYPKCKFVVLTGGEPTLQVDKELTDILHKNGYYISMETNGTNIIPEGIDWVTCSPKAAFVKGGLVRITTADEVKVVFDGEHAVSTCGIKSENLYVQPCDTGDEEKNAKIVIDTVRFVEEHPEWQLSLQTHKILHVR